MTQPNGEKHIVTDDDERLKGLEGANLLAEQNKLKTPSALKLAWKTDQEKCQPTKFEVESGFKPFKEWARVDVDGQFSDTTLALEITVTCNPDYMCEPRDLVPVYLERGTDDFVFMIALLEPTREQNQFKITAEYPLRKLAIALGVTTKGPTPLAALKASLTELGVTAQWLANTTGVNGPNHVSGGVFEKGGSGKIFLRQRTAEDFAATEKNRNTEWNMAERLTAARGRPVFVDFKAILAEGKEMATTLEAESEYQVTPDTLKMIIEKMDGLFAAASKPFDISSMTKSVKVYTDQYFDLMPPSDEPAYPLLANSIVLRRRMVEGDPEGTYLFTLKGSTFTHGNERIRLAAQANLVEDMIATAEGMLALRDFLRDKKNGDNAFARVLHHVWTDRGLTDLLDGEWTVRPSIMVVSDRVKYGMKFADATVIEFSADTATCVFEDRTETVCSFELGVGHPGLTAGSTPTALSMASRISQFDTWGGSVPTPLGAQASTAVGPRPIIRPYHLPADLRNTRLFQKSDFKKYVKLRDELITQLFVLGNEDLKPGGNKATVLAELLGLIKKS